MTKEDADEELEPLFDYTRVQPINIFIDDDDDLVPLSYFPAWKRKRRTDLDVEDGKKKKRSEMVVIADDDDNNDKGRDNKEEDWMPLPPPSVCKSRVRGEEDMILREIRLKKQELASFAQKPEDLLKAVLESAKKELHGSEKSVLVLDVDEPSKPERKKILISIQDKDGKKAFRMYMDDKLERLFKMYADKAQLKLETLVFMFDGDKLSPTATPANTGLEDDDIIEVHAKSH